MRSRAALLAPYGRLPVVWSLVSATIAPPPSACAGELAYQKPAGACVDREVPVELIDGRVEDAGFHVPRMRDHERGDRAELAVAAAKSRAAASARSRSTGTSTTRAPSARASARTSSRPLAASAPKIATSAGCQRLSARSQPPWRRADGRCPRRCLSRARRR